MAHRTPLKSFLILFISVLFLSEASAQDGNYGFSFYPDLWYNDVDGIRVGLRTLGEQEGTFLDGPHRLDAGLWLSTWFPDNPVSYYVSFTEPIPAISDVGNEGSIQAVSSIRAGYSAHKLQFNKRWQPAFDELNYKEVSVYFSQEKMFDEEYRPYPLLWQNNWKSILGAQFRFSANPENGQFLGVIDLKQNVNPESGSFTLGTIELLHRFDLSDKFKFRLRGFAGFGTETITPEHRFLVSMNSPQNWLDHGVSRSKGTIPQPWLEAGSFQVGGGANLRGYLNSDIEMLNDMSDSPFWYFPVFRSIQAVNMEFEFPNFIDSKINEINIIGKLTSLRTYFFFDLARLSDSDFNPTNTGAVDLEVDYLSGTKNISDAGAGLQISFNIPDYLGKDRGIFIRYDVPFWLSDPSGSESNFSFRQLIGIGAIISF